MERKWIGQRKRQLAMQQRRKCTPYLLTPTQGNLHILTYNQPLRFKENVIRQYTANEPEVVSAMQNEYLGKEIISSLRHKLSDRFHSPAGRIC